jgi:hypothetical protein
MATHMQAVRGFLCVSSDQHGRVCPQLSVQSQRVAMHGQRVACVPHPAKIHTANATHKRMHPFMPSAQPTSDANTQTHTNTNADEMTYPQLSAAVGKVATQLAPSGMHADYLEDFLLTMRAVIEQVK